MSFLQGLRQKIVEQISGSAGQPLRLTDLGSLATDPVLPPHAELTRAGRRFGAIVGNGATYKAPVQAVPLLLCTWALWNGESDGGKSYVVDLAGAFSASGTLGLGMGLLLCVSRTRQALPTAYASSVISSLSGGSQSSKARLVNAMTLTGDQPAWQLVESRDQVSAISVGSGLVHRADGRIIIPPGGALGLDVLAPVGTSALFGASFSWAEVKLELD